MSSSLHLYCSTACHHGLHDECRLSCKWCREPCCCICHDEIARESDEERLNDRTGTYVCPP
jgi:hypothetical protein